MTEIHKALVAFWRKLGLPVYLQGEVRQDKENTIAFPFVTIDIRRSALGSDTMLNAFVWFKDDGGNVDELRASYMDNVEQLIPDGGVLVEMEHGSMAIYRQPEFLMLYDDPDANSRVVGFRCAYVARIYHER